MTSRALTRAGLPPTPHIDLPTGPRPQYVDSNGFEADDEVEVDTGAEAEAAESEAEEVEEAAEDPDGDVEMTEDAVIEPEEDKEPLLGLAESLVVPFSLIQTRQRHLTDLLPHIFSHPPIPSHSKPRARPPPKSTFLFPTPPPPAQPLPIKEYHGHSVPAVQVSAASEPTPSPAVEGQSPKPALATSTAKAKSRAKQKEDAIPAHEIECIARVTVTIGPISYPGTELWVGRFVEPRLEGPKRAARREKGEKGERPKRPSTAGAGAAKRARLSATPATASPAPSARPPVQGQFGAPRPPIPMPRPPTARPPPPRSGIEPALIQRVNQAATQNPWLSIIIHKAARNQASKEELAKLGRVVARLGRGEGVGEGPLDGLTPVAGSSSSASRPPPPPTRPTQSAATPAATAQAAPTAAPPAPSNPVPAPPSDQSSDLSDISDEEMDGKGPKQVGGGPIDPELIPETAKRPPVPTPPIAPPPTTATASSLAPPPIAKPTSEVSTPARPSIPVSNSSNITTLNKPPAPTHYSYPPNAASQTAPILLPPPPPPPTLPPRRTFPLPAPFLLLAFKETPTEKFLLPLGSLSYISRVGGDYVTHPAPPPPPPPPPTTKSDPNIPPSASIPIAVPATGRLEPSAPSKAEAVPASSIPVNSSVAAEKGGRGRTRASLGRGAKEAKEIKEVKEEEKPTTHAPTETQPEEPVMIEPVKQPPASNLPPLPGMEPSAGTVLVSTIVPVSEWLKPDWEKLEKRLPFYTSDYDEKPTVVKAEHGLSVVPATSPAAKPLSKSKEPSSPIRSLRHVRSNSYSVSKVKIDKRTMLNLAVENFMPQDSAVQAVTVRLEGLEDRAWSTVKRVIQIVETAEMKSIADQDPSLLEDLTPPVVTDAGSGTPVPSPLARRPFNPALHPKLQKAYSNYRRSRFEALLKRVPVRTFPKYRLPEIRSDLLDATTDRWAPRPYPLSTRPLYLTSPPPEGADDSVAYEPAPVLKKKRNQEEEQVMFELPVSLDQLDERVELGAKKSVNRRVGKLKMKKPDDPNKKRYGKRYVAGMICEGCAGAGLKVWRRGPGGNRTLCNACGDKFLSGTLGELKAPGAASTAAGGEEEDGVEAGKDTVEGDGVKVEEEEGAEKTEEAPRGPEVEDDGAGADVTGSAAGEPIILDPTEVSPNPAPAAVADEEKREATAVEEVQGKGVDAEGTEKSPTPPTPPVPPTEESDTPTNA